jgi:3-deoxy-manno-octulosonate cytidylyltransferase (CMP-KDO synthetase)
MRSLVIIPARFNSSRFPGKPLVNINGKSMIQRVFEQVQKCQEVTDIIIATDDIKIFDHVKSFNGSAIMTLKNHLSGTDRCNEVVKKIEKKYDVIINVQGDEPIINPKQITKVINCFKDNSNKIVTLAKKISSKKEIEDPNTVKVDFSSEMIATNFYRTQETLKSITHKHLGIYGFKTTILEKICALPATRNELKHKLEQLRWLDNDYKIKIAITDFDSIAIDTKDDLENLLKNHSDKLA